MKMSPEQLRKAYYHGGGPPKPYVCGCGESFAVSDERREHRKSCSQGGAKKEAA